MRLHYLDWPKRRLTIDKVLMNEVNKRMEHFQESYIRFAHGAFWCKEIFRYEVI